MFQRPLLTTLAAAALVVSVSPVASALDLRQGFRRLGGQIAITYQKIMPNSRDNTDGGTANEDSVAGDYDGGTFVIAPEFGYLVIDNLELMADLTFTTGFGNGRFSDRDTEIGFDIGVRYFFTAGAINPYIGALLGMAFHIPDDKVKFENRAVDTTKDFVIKIPIGILIPLLNEHIAIDIGLRIEYFLALDERSDADFADIDTSKASNSQAKTVTADRFVFPVGYLGVAAFW